MESRLESTLRCPHSDAVSRYAPLSPDFAKSPFATLALLRQGAPVFFSEEIGCWIVTRYEDVCQCDRDQEAFSAAVVIEPLHPLWESALRTLAASGFRSCGALANEDPPIHGKRRNGLAKAFSLRRLKDKEPYIRGLVTQCLDSIVLTGRSDLVANLANKVPIAALFNICDMPPDRIEDVARWAAQLSMFSWGRPSESEQNEMAVALGQYWRFAEDHIQHLKRNLGDDWISEAIRGQSETPDLWSDDGLAHWLIYVTLAGYETTSGSMALALRILLDDGEAWRRICRNPGLIPAAIEECLRLESSVFAWRRQTKRPVTLSGIEIPANAKVLIYLGSANRDESVFTDADQFVLGRPNANQHVAFGFGPHMCVGAPLARMEMRIMLEELTRRLPHLRRIYNPSPSFGPQNVTFRRPSSVLVEWDPASNPLLADRPA